MKHLTRTLTLPRVILFLIVVFGWAVYAQPSPPTNVELLGAPPPPPVSGVSVSGASSGTSSYCWWVVPTYPIGNGAVSNPACLNGVQPLSASFPVTVSWPSTPSATSYRVLRTLTPVYPSGVCTGCSITTTASTAYSDTGTTGTDYNQSAASGAKYTLFLDNLTESAPVVRTQLGGTTYTQPQVSGTPTPGNCVGWGTQGKIVDTGAVCGGSGSGVTTGVTLTADLPVIGAGGSAIASGTRSGNTTQYVTTTGTQTAGDCVTVDSDGNHIAAGAPCSTPITPGYSPNARFSGGGVEWTSGLNLTVGAAAYQINGVTLTSVLTDLSLATADPTDPRIDMITLTSAGTATVVTGVAAPSPVEPVVDPSTQLPLAFVTVAAGATIPDGITITDIYKDMSSWATSQIGGTFNTASLNFPYEGVTSIEGTSAIAGNYVQFISPSTLDLAEFNNLVFYIRSKGSWPGAKSLQLTWFNVALQQGVTISIATGQFGFSGSVTSTYQQIRIPVSLFGLAGIPVDRLRVIVAGGGGSIGMYMDAFSLQAGIADPAPAPGMVWKGAWNALAAYGVNDVVNLAGVSYVATAPNTNSSPTPANTNWSKVGGVQTYAAVANQFLTSVSSAGLPVGAQPAFVNINGTATAAQIPSNVKVRTFGATFVSSDGVTALTAGAKTYLTLPFTCTISAWNIAVDAGTATIDIWKIATGTAIPTVANTITAAAKPAIAANTAARSTTLTGWTTAVATNDIIGFKLDAVATATFVNIVLECNQ